MSFPVSGRVAENEGGLPGEIEPREKGFLHHGSSLNDADRLRKYLARFSLEWQQVSNGR
jgi:hypothetical protein